MDFFLVASSLLWIPWVDCALGGERIYPLFACVTSSTLHLSAIRFGIRAKVSMALIAVVADRMLKNHRFVKNTYEMSRWKIWGYKCNPAAFETLQTSGKWWFTSWFVVWSFEWTNEIHLFHLAPRCESTSEEALLCRSESDITVSPMFSIFENTSPFSYPHIPFHNQLLIGVSLHFMMNILA